MQPNFNYLVRIIPTKKSDAQTFEWHGVHNVFTSPTTLKIKLMDTFKDKLPPTPDSFQIGYMAKRSAKRAIENDLDLTSMYKQLNDESTITLYCETKSTADSTCKRKRKSPVESESDVEDHETEVKKVAEKLLHIHGKDKYDSRQLTLWGRMIVNKQWKSYDDPPDVPLITGGAKKIPRRESLSEVITGAALALTKAFTTPSKQSSEHVQVALNPPTETGVSPASKARLSSEYITQLKSLQELREVGVLTDEEFQEQKLFALNNIRSMNKRK